MLGVRTLYIRVVRCLDFDDALRFLTWRSLLFTIRGLRLA